MPFIQAKIVQSLRQNKSPYNYLRFLKLLLNIYIYLHTSLSQFILF